MKCTAAIVVALLLSFSASAQKEAPKGYVNAPARSITGDFDGDGTIDTFSQFIVDSLDNKVEYTIEIQDWNNFPEEYTGQFYANSFSLNGKSTDIDNHVAVGLYCLFNLGNINSTKGDEIALVPFLQDYDKINTCHIYSYCNGAWAEVFAFSINEMSVWLSETPITDDIPEVLEKRNGKWVYMDYMEWFNAEQPIQMKPLKVGNCN